MARTVFDNHMVAHVWAQRTQSEGRSANRNFYFEGRTLFSYGSHFVVAHITTTLANERCALFNSRIYSVSTSRHQAIAHSAWRGNGPTYTVDDPRADTVQRHTDNVRGLLALAKKRDEQAARARRYKEFYQREASYTRATAKEYHEAFIGPVVSIEDMEAGFEASEIAERIYRARKLMRDQVDSVRYAMAKDKLGRKAGSVRYHAKRAAEHHKQLVALQADAGQELDAMPAIVSKALAVLGEVGAEDVSRGFRIFAALEDQIDDLIELRTLLAEEHACWRAHMPYRKDTTRRFNRILWDRVDKDGTMLRVSKDGDTIETSQGADFPAAHAKRAWPLLKAIKAKGEAWHANGHTIRLGHFQVDRVTAEGTVYAGCHVVKWSEVARMARALGLD